MDDLTLAIYDLSPQTGSNNPNTKFSRNVCKILDIPLSDVEIIKFKDGETDLEIKNSVRKKKIFVFQSYVKPIGERKYELEQFVDAVKWGGNKAGIVVVWPYCFGSRGERRTRPRQPCPTKIFAETLGRLHVETLLTGGVHAESIGAVYNAEDVYFEQLGFESIVVNYILRNYRESGSVAIGSPDTGGLKRVRNIEELLNDKEIQGMEDVSIKAATFNAEKLREKGDRVKEMNILDSIKGLDVILIDDIAGTLGTLLTAAQKCREGGAKSVRALLYHPVLGDGYEKHMKELLDNKLVDELVLGNTVPVKSFAIERPEVKLLPFEPLFAEAIKRMHADESVSELFGYEGIMEVYDKARHLFKADQKYVKIGRIKLPTLNS